MELTFKFLFYLVLSTLLFACKKDKDHPQSMSCKLDALSWMAAEGQAGITIEQGLIRISGKAADGTSLILTLNGTAPGTYKLTQGGNNVGVYSPDSTSASFASNQGLDPTATVVISEINTTDSTMSGSFQFTGFRPSDNSKKVITEGKFINLKFALVTNSTATGTFKCKLDGVQFTADSSSGTSISGYLKIAGSASSGLPKISLFLNPNISIGTSNIGPFGTANYATYNKTSTVYLTSTLGEVAVYKHDKMKKIIEGTFHFDAAELLLQSTSNISEGSFSIQY